MKLIVSKPITTFDRPIARATEALYKAVLVDEKDPPSVIKGSDLESIVLSLFDGNQIFNSIQDVSILNVDRGTIDEDGNLSILLSSSDTDFSGTESIVRNVVYKWTYSGGKKGRHQFKMNLIPLAGDG